MTTGRLAIFVTSRDRPEMLAALLRALRDDPFQDFTVIVLLQAGFPEHRFINPLAGDPRVDVRHGPALSLSAARNSALQDLDGDVVWLADDDCRPPPETITFVMAVLAASSQIDFLSVRSTDEDGEDSMGRFPTAPCDIHRANVWNTAVSYTVFWRRKVIDGVGQFDEDLGVGAPTRWGAGEETDYVLRALSAGFRGRFDNRARVIHPRKTDAAFGAGYRRHRSYALGVARVLQKNGFGALEVTRLALRTLVGCVWLTLSLRANETPHRLVGAYHRTIEYFRLRLARDGR